MACAILNRKSNLDWGVSFIIIKHPGGWGSTCKSSSAKNTSAGCLPCGICRAIRLNLYLHLTGKLDFLSIRMEKPFEICDFDFFARVVGDVMEKLGELFLHSFF